MLKTKCIKYTACDINMKSCICIINMIKEYSFKYYFYTPKMKKITTKEYMKVRLSRRLQLNIKKDVY